MRDATSRAAGARELVCAACAACAATAACGREHYWRRNPACAATATGATVACAAIAGIAARAARVPMTSPAGAPSELAVVSIGCTEPWNAAGLGLDIRALAACGVRPMTVVTGVTAQNARGLSLARPVAPDLIAAQLAALDAAPLGAYRIGALLDVASVVAVAAHLRARPAPAVYDPVLATSAGGAFADAATREAIATILLPHVTLATPNLAEAAALTGLATDDALPAMEAAASALRALGAQAALVTGGHRTNEPIDVLADAGGIAHFAGTRLAGELRGTGCLLACATAASLARGATLRAAIATGRRFVRERFASAVTVAGMRVAF